ncbi:hypothetical protein DUNSADRAFT_6031, partial [Dunaliella salina]
TLKNNLVFAVVAAPHQVKRNPGDSLDFLKRCQHAACEEPVQQSLTIQQFDRCDIQSPGNMEARLATQHNATSNDSKQKGQNKAEGVVSTTVYMPYSFWKTEFKSRLLPAVLDCLVEVNGRLRQDTHKIVVSPSLKVTGLHTLAVERYGGYKIMRWSKADSRTVVWHLRDPKSYRHLRHTHKQQEAAAMAAAAAAAAANTASKEEQPEPKLLQGGASSNATPSPMSSVLHNTKVATTNSEGASPCSPTMLHEVCVCAGNPVKAAQKSLPGYL